MSTEANDAVLAALQGVERALLGARDAWHETMNDKDYSCWGTPEKIMEQRYYDAGKELGLQEAMFMVHQTINATCYPKVTTWEPDADAAVIAFINRRSPMSVIEAGDLVRRCEQVACHERVDTVTLAIVEPILARW